MDRDQLDYGNSVGDNWSASTRSQASADPELFEFVKLMQELQVAVAVGFELETDPKTHHDIIFVLNKEGLTESTLQKSRRAAEIMGLEPGRDQYRVLYAPFKTDPATLAIQTRSVIQMLAAMAGFIDFPDENAPNALPGFDLARAARPFHVRSGPDRPEQSFAAVKYQDYWHRIDNSDLASKRVFTLMLFITTLTSQAGGYNTPVLTIPTQ